MPKPQPPQPPQPPKAAGPAAPDATEWRSIKNDLDLAKGILDEAATVVPNLVPAGEAREITMAVLFALRDICTSVDQELAKTLMGRTKQSDDIDTLISGALANVKSSNMILNFALPLLGKLAGLLIGKMNVSPYLQAVLVGVLEGVAQLLQEPALQKDLSNLPVLGEIESFLGGGTQHKAA
ncbi:hypothetical protein [Pseudovibrio sp. SPO723]|uniref:hypothetical protein n=1 Tax=Nesiotobacter zosterae TaxID=392721 RepID=UPI0029C2C3E6|nr:hypothetical protein [Pseudovibrio sp. SPO723]MDX5593304.1 hypothetical protein [Pseudovibrio sp. SPO723]